MKKLFLILGIFLLINSVSAARICPWQTICDDKSGTGWGSNTSYPNENLTYWGSSSTGTDNGTFLQNGTYFTSNTANKQIFYLSQTLTNGTFTVNVFLDGASGNFYPLILGSQTLDTGTPTTTGNKYLIFVDSPNIRIRKVVAASATTLQSKTTQFIPQSWMNITIEWYPRNTTTIIVWVNGTSLLSSTDNTFTDGYAGIGTSSPTALMKWNGLNLSYHPVPIANLSGDVMSCVGSCSVAFTDDSFLRGISTLRNYTVNGTQQTSGIVTTNPTSMTFSPSTVFSVQLNNTVFNNCTYTTSLCEASNDWDNYNLSTNIWNVTVTSGGGIAPVADFSCSPLAMVRMNKTNCDDLSTNTPTSWLWYGADGCVVNSTSENPVLQFGNYSYCKTLCLMATNADGSDTECKSNYIYISQPWAWF